MAWKELKKKSINDIFKAMDICDELNTCKFENSGDCLKSCESVDDNNEDENLSELSRALKGTAECKSFENATDAAIQATLKRDKLSFLNRADALCKIWKTLQDISKSLPNLGNELLTLGNYFDFYADALTPFRREGIPSPRVVLVVLTNYSPFFILGATVAPALATGCSVVVLVPENVKMITLFLEEVVKTAGLPDGTLNTVTGFNETTVPFSDEIKKVIFCGSYTSAVKLHRRYAGVPFKFFCPGNTTAFILESADLDAAADRIVRERCVRNSVFAISNIIIQESVSKIFLEKFKFRMQQFMNTNKKSKVKDFRITEKVSKITADALKSGAVVEKYEDFENEIGQTIAINYQNQDVDEDGTILKVLLCRTAKEGVALSNNCRYSLGTSVWSEISSQALEVSSMLTCPNIWINSHGVFEAGEPLQLLGFSGNCVLGGRDGILEFVVRERVYGLEVNPKNETKAATTEKVNVLQTVSSAQNAFNTWKNKKNRREYLKDIADSLEKAENFSHVSQIIRNLAHLGSLTTSSQRNPQGRLIIKRKIPVGVTLLIVDSTEIDIRLLATLITAPIAFGNAVIVVLEKVNSEVNLLLETFTKALPKNVIKVISGIENAICLASHPNIQNIWIFPRYTFKEKFDQAIEDLLGTGPKNIWLSEGFSRITNIVLTKQCLRNQLVWLTDVDQFP